MSPTGLSLESGVTKSVPSVTKIVYSTCSVHALENEHVVQAVLDAEEAKVGKFTLAPRNEVLPTWQRRGLDGHLSDHGKSEIFPLGTSLNPSVSDNAASLVRCLPGEDRTNGFFVACFVKTKEPLAWTANLKSSHAMNDKPRSNRPRKKRKLGSF